MFTGIVTSIGTVAEAKASGNARCFTIATELDISGWKEGCSIACAGVCLTVIGSRSSVVGKESPSTEHRAPSTFTVDISPETLFCTTLGEWKEGTKINLEPALKLGDELGGHIVTGHVDGVGIVRESGIGNREDSHRTLTIEAPVALMPLIALKGSIAVDGVSLTVNRVEKNLFTVNLIPHTLAVTTLGHLKEGSKVNLEADMLARYVARLKECG